MIHGADILSYKTDRDLIDFSSNINPLGYPTGLMDFIISEFDNVKSYPDIQYRELRDSLSRYLKTEAKYIVPGNGAMEIIDGVLSKFNRCIIPYPSFIEYELRAKENNCEIEFIAPNPDLSLNMGVLESVIENCSDNGYKNCLIIGNPNNPTGYVLSLEEIKSIHSLCMENGVTLILDEAFFEFTDSNYDTVEYANSMNYKNIIIVRAATKFFGLPGIRLGYGIMNEDNVNFLKHSLNPWSVNSFAESAGRYVFNDRVYINESVEYIKKEREFLYDQISSLNSFKIFKSRSNYMLLKAMKNDVNELFDFLIKNGILIRLCSTFRGLDNTYIRIAVKSHDDNSYLIKKLKEFYNAK